MSKLLKLCCLLLPLLGCSIQNELKHQLKSAAQVFELPAKDNLWIFIMAGQSNMAGRGVVEARDKIPNDRVLTINSSNEIVSAVAPMHFYEQGAGLGCGRSFGGTMLRHLPDDVSILLIPTAVGGSSLEQWIGDEQHREVQLLSNFRQRLNAVQKYGILKGILWHQGEADAHREAAILSYRDKLKILFDKFRKIAGNDSLPIVAGKLGSFATNKDNWDRINAAIETYVRSDEHCGLVETADLDHKGDHLHFNAAAQRLLGKRYAEKMVELCVN